MDWTLRARNLFQSRRCRRRRVGSAGFVEKHVGSGSGYFEKYIFSGKEAGKLFINYFVRLNLKNCERFLFGLDHMLRMSFVALELTFGEAESFIIPLKSFITIKALFFRWDLKFYAFDICWDFIFIMKPFIGC